MKRHGRLEREKGIDNDPDHHAVLFKLRLLDDDDNYDLFCEMRNEVEAVLGDLSPEQWGSYMRFNYEPPLTARLATTYRMLQTMPDDDAGREQFVERFIRSEYGRLEAEAALHRPKTKNILDAVGSIRPDPGVHVSVEKMNAWASAPFIEVTGHEQLEGYPDPGRDHDELA